VSSVTSGFRLAKQGGNRLGLEAQKAAIAAYAASGGVVLETYEEAEKRAEERIANRLNGSMLVTPTLGTLKPRGNKPSKMG
jgi:hypothetical protein